MVENHVQVSELERSRSSARGLKKILLFIGINSFDPKFLWNKMNIFSELICIPLLNKIYKWCPTLYQRARGLTQLSKSFSFWNLASVRIPDPMFVDCLDLSFFFLTISSDHGIFKTFRVIRVISRPVRSLQTSLFVNKYYWSKYVPGTVALKHARPMDQREP